MSESWTINSDVSLTAFCANVKQLFNEHRYLTFGKPRIGPDRSLDQSALFHVWLREIVAHYMGIHVDQVEFSDVEETKKTIKKLYYCETGYPWMIKTGTCPLTGRTKRSWQSSAKYSHDEMFTLLTWMQAEFANKGLILESKGKFAKAQRERNE